MHIRMYPCVANFFCTKLSLQGFPRIIQQPEKRMMIKQHKYPQHPQQGWNNADLLLVKYPLLMG